MPLSDLALSCLLLLSDEGSLAADDPVLDRYSDDELATDPLNELFSAGLLVQRGSEDVFVVSITDAGRKVVAAITTAQAENEALRARVAELLEFLAAREAVEAAIRVYGGARYPEDVRDAYRDLCNAQERLKNASTALSGSQT